MTKNKKLSFVFLGTPAFSVPSLEALYKSKKHNLKGVITQPDRPRGRGQKTAVPEVKEFCLKNKIPCFQFSSLNSKEGVACLKKLKPDIIIVVSFGQLLSQEILDLVPLGCINAHASLLPKYRGAAPINWSIIKGEKETGVCIIKLVKKMDAGPVLLSKKVTIKTSDTAESLYKNLSSISGPLLIKSLDLLAENKTLFKEQDHSKTSFAPQIKREDCKINWNQKAKAIYNFVRGLSPKPCSFTSLHGQYLKVYSLKLTKIKSQGKPGATQETSEEGILVNTEDSCVLLTDIQLANKKRMKASQFIQGRKLEKGTQLGK